jgi:hypothetical protein
MGLPGEIGYRGAQGAPGVTVGNHGHYGLRVFPHGQRFVAAWIPVAKSATYMVSATTEGYEHNASAVCWLAARNGHSNATSPRSAITSHSSTVKIADAESREHTVLMTGVITATPAYSGAIVENCSVVGTTGSAGFTRGEINLMRATTKIAATTPTNRFSAPTSRRGSAR